MSIPVIVLTGFLGAGKTSLVNHLLRAAQGRRLAVMVNEFGALGIDGRLVRGAAVPVVELANGCICCATQGDLLRSLNALLAGDRALDGVLVETSGLADPAPIVAALEGTGFARDVSIGCVVTVVDAANFDAGLDQAEAAFQQLTAADLVVLNKTDLVDAGAPDLIGRAVAKLNPGARMIACVGADVLPDLVLGLDRIGRPAIEAASSHRHDYESVCLSVDAPLDPARFDEWLDSLPPSVYRAKGLVRFAAHAEPFAFHLVAGRRSGEPASGQGIAGAELVLIGKNIAAVDFRSGLTACTVRPC